MKVGVFGSRTLKWDSVRLALHEKFKELKPDVIVTAQEPFGVCKVAQYVAKELSIPLELHFLNFKYLRWAFDHRSRAVVSASDYMIIIHDGKSKGTSNELELIKKRNVPYYYEIQQPESLENIREFNLYSIEESAAEDGIDSIINEFDKKFK